MWKFYLYGCVMHVVHIVVSCIWVCYVYGCVMHMGVLCIWMCYAYGCVMYMDVLCIWMCYVYGCVMCKDSGRRAGGEEARRTGCIQNENPHIGEWWENELWSRLFFQNQVVPESVAAKVAC